MLQSTVRRTIAKAVVWKIIGISSLLGIGLISGVGSSQIGIVTVVYHSLMLVLYVIHERFWNKVDWGRKLPPTYDTD